MALISRERGGISVLRGTVVGASVSTRELPGGASSQVRFQLDGVPIVWRGDSMLAAGDGEDMIVAGFFRGSEYWVLAWWNMSRGFGGHQDRVVFWPGMMCLAVGLVVLGSVLVRRKVGALEGIFVAGVLLVFGATMTRSGFVIGEAVKAVRRVRSQGF